MVPARVASFLNGGEYCDKPIAAIVAMSTVAQKIEKQDFSDDGCIGLPGSWYVRACLVTPARQTLPSTNPKIGLPLGSYIWFIIYNFPSPSLYLKRYTIQGSKGVCVQSFPSPSLLPRRGYPLGNWSEVGNVSGSVHTPVHGSQHSTS